MRTTGQLLRMVGLLIEMIGLVGIALGRGGDQGLQVRIPGGSTISASWLAVAIGFVVWLVATILLAATRPPRKGQPPTWEL
jgi:hypothetical protein